VKQIYFQLQRSLFLALLLPLLAAGCAATGAAPEMAPADDLQSRDRSCSYFYFLWGTHAEYEKRYEEAIDAYEKALVCDPSAHYIKHKMVLTLLNKGDTAATITLLEENLASDPEDTASRKLLAGLLARQNRTEAAIEQYQTILSYDPENEAALLRLGILLEQKGDIDTAKATLEKLIRVNPDSYFGYLALARMSDSPQLSAEYYGQAIRQNWSSDLAYEIAQFQIDRQNYNEAITLLREVVDKDDSPEQARLMIVQSLLGQGQEEEAIAELSLIPAYRNSPVQLSLVLAKLYVRLDDYPQAAAHLEEVLKQHSDSGARYLLGVIYSDMERYRESLAVLERIEPVDEEFEDAVFIRGRLLHQLERHDQALEMLTTYLADDLTRKPTFFIMAASLYQDDDQPQKAVELLKMGAETYPDDERLLFEYGLQLERTDQLDRAISVMEQLIKVNPDHAEALNFVGYSWADSDRNLEQALSYITRAMELKPDNGYIQDSLGWVYYKLGDLERARSELIGALKLLPEDPYILEHMGDVYRALGEVSKALEAYRKALDSFDDREKTEQVETKIDALLPK
jgi:tetratricopeptide (TPR) repeat protein